MREAWLQDMGVSRMDMYILCVFSTIVFTRHTRSICLSPSLITSSSYLKYQYGSCLTSCLAACAGLDRSSPGSCYSAILGHWVPRCVSLSHSRYCTVANSRQVRGQGHRIQCRRRHHSQQLGDQCSSEPHRRFPSRIRALPGFVRCWCSWL